MNSLISALVFLFADAFLAATHTADGFALLASPPPYKIEKCLMAGIEVRYRFRARVCRRGESWTKHCGREIEETHLVRYDRISETFYLTVDRLDDSVQPRTLQFNNREDALRATQVSESFTLASLADEDSTLLPSAMVPFSSLSSAVPTSPSITLEGRVLGYCRGERSILSRITEQLTFGLIGRPPVDTQWERFSLTSFLASNRH